MNTFDGLTTVGQNLMVKVTLEKELICEARVLQVGMNEQGVPTSNQIAVGDTVIFSKYAGLPLESGDNGVIGELRVLPLEDVVAFRKSVNVPETKQ
jgi:co-chaperonin GroES (HSP10)